jgi:hypothetical protein
MAVGCGCGAEGLSWQEVGCGEPGVLGDKVDGGRELGFLTSVSQVVEEV